MCNVVIDVDGSSARWLGFNTFDCCGPGSVPGWGTEVLQATQQGHQKKERYGLLNSIPGLLSCIEVQLVFVY